MYDATLRLFVTCNKFVIYITRVIKIRLITWHYFDVYCIPFSREILNFQIK